MRSQKQKNEHNINFCESEKKKTAKEANNKKSDEKHIEINNQIIKLNLLNEICFQWTR